MKISVIIPVYNAEKYLHRCLNSIVDQTYSNWEVIAIDDGSKDTSYSILLDYFNRDKRFKVYTHQNKGPGFTRNRAIEYISGEYIVFIDSDDYIEANYFEDLVNCVNENNSDVVFVDVIQEKPNGDLIKYELMSKYNGASKDKIIRHQITGKLPWGGCRKAVKANLITNNDIRYTLDTVGEEALFSLKILLKANKISFLDKPYYHYVNYPNSQSKKGDYDPWGEICVKISNYLKEIELFDEYKEVINSFGYTALIVSIYRISKNYNYFEAIKLSRLALERFKSIYNFELDKDCLEIRTKCVLPFVKMGFLFPIVIIAKIKSLKSK